MHGAVADTAGGASDDVWKDSVSMYSTYYQEGVPRMKIKLPVKPFMI